MLSIDELLRLIRCLDNNNSCLIEENNRLRRLVFKQVYSVKQKHIYKVEMERMKRKLTRIYEAVAIMHDNECICPDVDTFKRI